MAPRHLGLFAVALAAAAAVARGDASSTVSHVHLALSTDTSQMHVQWTSAAAVTTENSVQYGASASALNNAVVGTAWTFTDSTSRQYFFHRATMTGLTPGATVFYRVGGASGWSPTRSFIATRPASDISSSSPLVIAWIGDLGVENDQALPYLTQEALAGVYDHVVHVGGALLGGRGTAYNHKPSFTIPPVLCSFLHLFPCPLLLHILRTTSTATMGQQATSSRPISSPSAALCRIWGARAM